MPDVTPLKRATVVYVPGRSRVGWTGTHKIAGTVTVEGTPAKRRVSLAYRGTGKQVATTMSASDGSYSFLYLPAGTYRVTASDKPANAYNAVVADRIYAVPMS